MSLNAQNGCYKPVKIQQSGIQFCLPEDWFIEEESGLELITINNYSNHIGTLLYSIGIDQLTDTITPAQYAKEYFDSNLSSDIIRTIIIYEKPFKINGRDFYTIKSKSTYTDNKGKKGNVFNISYYYTENKIGYILDYVLSSENIDKWTEKDSLLIFNTFKINSAPDSSLFD